MVMTHSELVLYYLGIPRWILIPVTPIRLIPKSPVIRSRVSSVVMGGISIVIGGTPRAGWFNPKNGRFIQENPMKTMVSFIENPIYQWMMQGGSPMTSESLK